jgi:hypothetical protein
VGVGDMRCDRGRKEHADDAAWQVKCTTVLVRYFCDQEVGRSELPLHLHGMGRSKR